MRKYLSVCRDAEVLLGMGQTAHILSILIKLLRIMFFLHIIITEVDNTSHITIRISVVDGNSRLVLPVKILPYSGTVDVVLPKTILL